MSSERAEHWNAAYRAKGEAGVSWFEAMPEVSLALIEEFGHGPETALIDIGGGASRLTDALIARGWTSLSVLDLSQAAIDAAKARLGDAAERVAWIVDDVTRWRPARNYDIWHDRAAFHFLTLAEDREAYAERLRAALAPGGHAIIATFASDGPERCSGLPVVRYAPAELAAAIGAPFVLVHSEHHIHTTPWGAAQAFQFSVLRREPSSQT
ncbi:MAG: class I SAM-dependent methyltransferase [Rhizobiales bacterium]|nr:class I SAM-dependent methyltransferase [Hyphomicrobiales bacterium]